MFAQVIVISAIVALANAHIAAWHKGMYCLNGYSHEEDLLSSVVAEPLNNATFEDFWLRGKCKEYPPADGDFLDLPAGGSVMLELASNRGLTTLSFDGKHAHTFPSNIEHPNYDDGTWDNTCIKEPNLHTENKTRASGTVLAIAYKSNIYDVMPEDMVIFSVLEKSPWHREAWYDIPANLPGCDDCICAWSWIPNGCGQANMEINSFKCRVTGARPDAPKLGKPVPAQWCENEPEKCVKGPKQITIFHQTENINTVHIDRVKQNDGRWASPGYNMKMGFRPGAQEDIFEPSITEVDMSTEQPTESPTSSPEPSEKCSFSTRSRSGHRKHQRRLFSFAGLSLYADEA